MSNWTQAQMDGWTKYNRERHDRLTETGQLVTCRLLLAGDYVRGEYDDADWGECGLCEGVIMNAGHQVAQGIGSACPWLRTPAGVPGVCSRVLPASGRVGWEISYGDKRLVAGSRQWVERALEEEEGDSSAVAERIARIAVSESGIREYLRKRRPADM